MIRSMYTVNRSMNVLQKRQENTSGNITNANTSGYKFKSMMQSTLEPFEMVNYSGGSQKDKKQVLGEYIFGNRVDEITTHIDQGSLYESGNFTDFAIEGEGYFTIELEGGGRAYTRNGNFRIDEEGALVTQSGERVLGSNGVIYADDSFEIDNTGAVIGTNERFLITDLSGYEDIIDRGDTIFTAPGAGTVLEEGKVMQNYLEASNVDFTKEMIDMIQVSREFEANQKMIQTADETLSKAVNELGRL